MTKVRPRPKVMHLTDAAAARVRELMAKSGNPAAGLRIGVKKGGCAGMEYTMDWTAEPGRFDEVVEDKGVRVLIDSKAVMFLLGTEMDFRIEKLKSGFVFNNPKSAQRLRLRRVGAACAGNAHRKWRPRVRLTTSRQQNCGSPTDTTICHTVASLTLHLFRLCCIKKTEVLCRHWPDKSDA